MVKVAECLHSLMQNNLRVVLFKHLIEEFSYKFDMLRWFVHLTEAIADFMLQKFTWGFKLEGLGEGVDGGDGGEGAEAEEGGDALCDGFGEVLQGRSVV